MFNNSFRSFSASASLGKEAVFPGCERIVGADEELDIVEVDDDDEEECDTDSVLLAV
jgi:hypothetical protein